MIPHLSAYLLVAGIVASVGACAVSYTAGRASRGAEIASLHAVANATAARNRQISKEIASAQTAYVESWTALRDQSRDEWLRLKASRDGRVPVVCAKSSGGGPDTGHGLEDASGEANRVLHAAVTALERGEEIERTLMLCQAELRQCAALR